MSAPSHQVFDDDASIDSGACLIEIEDALKELQDIKLEGLDDYEIAKTAFRLAEISHLVATSIAYIATLHIERATVGGRAKMSDGLDRSGATNRGHCDRGNGAIPPHAEGCPIGAEPAAASEEAHQRLQGSRVMIGGLLDLLRTVIDLFRRRERCPIYYDTRAPAYPPAFMQCSRERGHTGPCK
jgi:hypothetical protein